MSLDHFPAFYLVDAVRFHIRERIGRRLPSLIRVNREIDKLVEFLDIRVHAAKTRIVTLGRLRLRDAMADSDQIDRRKIERRRDDALRHALNTSPKPRKPKPKKDESPTKRTAGKGRARVGKSRK